MSKQNILLTITLVGVMSIFGSNLAFARGILGPQPGDRSPEDNEGWLKTGVEQLEMAIKGANEGNVEMSVEHAKASMAAMKEISSEGWDGKRQRSSRAIRHGISAARKGNLEQAALEYRAALKWLDDLKYGDMNFTHESFMGIGDRK